MTYDLAVAGAGILGLAHALAAARRGLKVVVIDRDAQANGASIRNFGFITVTGQERGACWRRAMRSRDVWAEVAPQAGIRIEHRGLAVAARRPEAAAVLEAFLATEMGEGCRMLSAGEAAAAAPALKGDALAGALWSGHEIRVESRDAIPKLAAWLESAHGVHFRRSAQVKEVAPPLIRTTTGVIRAESAVVCPGDDFLSLFPERIAAYGVTKCKLQMLRVDPGEGSPRLDTAIMSDLGLVRYLGYAALPEAAALKARLQAEQADALAHGIHLIVVRSADGSLVVGDSHHYGATPDPFSRTDVDQLIMDEFNAVLDFPAARITERWTGIYASAPDRLMFVDKPAERVRLAMITSGTGASTSFAIAEETIRDLFA
ncbi:MAG: TIGR03364 family FAD-dependent oxidoreductase [Methylocystis sp.]|nr:TIGR03364 family FAD-dependent oxidoreductase [Methylocystis sp.]MCA3582388.1 TIGR03364 family FAD-dependent oxidoreductase [Methylocystis sp.]MCA3588283.1 TIGR03364 family FAD-dependent oxidoreductase [Methylocystis sp.]MCA3590201.1 TIGR03364 family FAD-dependent oxidoreductase [Methylocystis sp.]